MHVDVAVGAKLGAFAAADAPVFDNDLEILLASDRTDRALRHAERVAAGSTGGGDEEMFVAQTIAEQTRDAVVRLGAGADAGIAAGAIVQVDEQEILRFEQSLVQKIVELQASGNRASLDRRGAAPPPPARVARERRGIVSSIEIEFARRNFDHIDRIERGARRSAV